MTEKPCSTPSIIERFESLPIIQDLRNRYDFEACVVVETDEEFDIHSAREYAFSSELEGRVRPEANKLNSRVRWFFEYRGDGILFALKFGTELPRVCE